MLMAYKSNQCPYQQSLSFWHYNNNQDNVREEVTGTIPNTVRHT